MTAAPYQLICLGHFDRRMALLSADVSSNRLTQQLQFSINFQEGAHCQRAGGRIRPWLETEGVGLGLGLKQLRIKQT